MWYLANVDLYKILCPPKLKGYELEHYQRFDRGDFIYMEAQAADTVYLISRGKVKISCYTKEGEEMVKEVLSRGELFGEMAIMGGEQREEYAVSVTDNTLLCPLTVDTMYDLMRRNKRFGLAIHKLIGLRYRRLERRLERLFFKDAPARLLEFIGDLVREQGKEREDGAMAVRHHYTQKDIADLIGVRRETVSKMLGDFAKEGLLVYSRKYIIVPHPEKLRQVAKQRRMAPDTAGM